MPARSSAQTDTVIAAVRVSAPMLRIHTVAAGGGSILSYGQARLKVGPESAGAFPGPMCYRHGGPLTVTDANLLLGRIQPDYFPRVFGPGGDQPLDREAPRAAFVALSERLAASAGVSLGQTGLLKQFLRVGTVGHERGNEPIKPALALDVPLDELVIPVVLHIYREAWVGGLVNRPSRPRLQSIVGNTRIWTKKMSNSE